MGNERIEQIKRSAGITAKVIKVFTIITKVSAIICLVGTILCVAGLFIPGDGILYQGEKVRVLLPTMSDVGTTGGFEIVKALNIENPLIFGAANCTVAVILLAVLTVLLTLVRNVFVEIGESDTPFTESI